MVSKSRSAKCSQLGVVWVHFHTSTDGLENDRLHRRTLAHKGVSKVIWFSAMS